MLPRLNKLKSRTVELHLPALAEEGVKASLATGSLFGSKVVSASIVSQRIVFLSDCSNASEVLREALLSLSQRSEIRGADLQVLVPDNLAVLEVVRCDPADVLRSNTRQMQRLAEVSIAEVLGDKATSYEVRWHVQADNEHLFVCALPRLLTQAINNVAQAYSLTLQSITPQFSHIWNVSLPQLSQTYAPQAVFLRASQEEAVLSCVRNGVITQISQSLSLKPSEALDVPDTVTPINQHVSTMSRLDALADRLLTALGEDPAQSWRFFASSQGLSRADFSPRWQMLA